MTFKKQIKTEYLRQGFSKNSVKHQRILTIKGDVIELLNINHGVIITLKVPLKGGSL